VSLFSQHCRSTIVFELVRGFEISCFARIFESDWRRVDRRRSDGHQKGVIFGVDDLMLAAIVAYPATNN
jgi:hypothetical protein